MLDKDGDHMHWPDEEVHVYSGRSDEDGKPGYDDNNGHHNYTYFPSEPFVAAPGYVQNNASAYQQGPYPGNHGYGQCLVAAPYWQTQVLPAQPYTLVNPGCYGSDKSVQHYQPAFNHHNPMMMYAGPPAGESVKPANPNHHAWIGRTKAQVEQDNMKVAKSGGAYDKREVAPVGLKADQVIWVVELDGHYTLRTFAAVKELKGTWKPDPRYEAAWFFVREDN